MHDNIATFLIAPLIPMFELNFLSFIALYTPRIVSKKIKITTIKINLFAAKVVINWFILNSFFHLFYVLKKHLNGCLDY
ncbi:hypothetical protein bsdtb5_33890 [Anaeromicropila herbilytica]|uniref:Uncharacterized protein n=1 Tax=Anaeromicropila herbilytica TaxID=2785025 RepID=A0A7R7ENH0_9FIRM|nr:hypothetical protein bsdtb5_33890 [Anaeromicropila herbilytica]